MSNDSIKVFSVQTSKFVFKLSLMIQSSENLLMFDTEKYLIFVNN